MARQSGIVAPASIAAGATTTGKCIPHALSASKTFMAGRESAGTIVQAFLYQRWPLCCAMDSCSNALTQSAALVVTVRLMLSIPQPAFFTAVEAFASST